MEDGVGLRPGREEIRVEAETVKFEEEGRQSRDQKVYRSITDSGVLLVPERGQGSGD